MPASAPNTPSPPPPVLFDEEKAANDASTRLPITVKTVTSDKKGSTKTAAHCSHPMSSARDSDHRMATDAPMKSSSTRGDSARKDASAIVRKPVRGTGARGSAPDCCGSSGRKAATDDSGGTMTTAARSSRSREVPIVDYASLRELDSIPSEEMKIDYSHDFFQPRFPLGVLAFDLDKTLVRTISLHVDEIPQTPLYDGQYFMFYDEDTTEFHHVYKRPFLEDLLAFLRKHVKGKVVMMLCTHGTEKYASTILKTCRCDDLFPILLPRKEWRRREFEDDYKQRRFKTIKYMAEHVGVRCEDVLMIDDDPAVFAKGDRVYGGLVHIKAFDNPTIQKSDKELQKLMKMTRGILKYGKNFYNIQFAHSIRYTGIANSLTLAAARRKKRKAAGEDVSADANLCIFKRLQLEHKKLRCKALWCLMWGLGIHMNAEERLSTLYLFDRFYAHQKIDWQAFYGDHALDEAVIHMFGCLFISRQYLFTDRKRPKQFRRDPRSCQLWQAHVDAYQSIVVKLTQLKSSAREAAKLKLIQEQSAAASGGLPKMRIPAVVDVASASSYILETATAEESATDVSTSTSGGHGHGSRSGGDVQPATGRPLSLDVDIEAKTSGGELDEEDTFLSEASPLSPKDPERDESPLPHLDNPFIHAHLMHESELKGKASMSTPTLMSEAMTDDSRHGGIAVDVSMSPPKRDAEEHPHACYNHLHAMPGASKRRLPSKRSRHRGGDSMQDAYFEDLNELCKLIRDGISYPYVLRGLFSRGDKKSDTTLFVRYSAFVSDLFAKVEKTRDITHFDTLK